LKPVDLEALVGTAIAQTTRTLTNAHMRWCVDISLDTPPLEADEHLLGQALVSLFTNAAESQSLQGTVSVKTARCSHDGRDHVRLSVEDEGVSVPRESLEHVFEPFFTTKAFGTGLGLSLVKRTVEAHSGHVSIGPRERGGTVVTLMLPSQTH
jgi:signal transduction histidine kinase